jgi:hypothetical protein
MSDLSDAISEITKQVTKKWTKQRLAEEKGRKSRSSRIYVYSDRTRFTEVCDEILPAAYEHASGRKYTVSKRQFYYACREQFQEMASEKLSYEYFAQTLLVQYMNRHPKETAGWKITADPRGTLSIPNAGHEVRIPIGTIDVENRLLQVTTQRFSFDDLDASLEIQWPSLAPGQRYQGVLYIEKEGFGPLLKEAGIADQFDIVIMSCKGHSVVAARRFVDVVCAIGRDVPLLTAHDFDKSGFEIKDRLTTVSGWAEEKDLVKYEFMNKIDVRDLGLRLENIEKYNLEDKAETCTFRGRFAKDSETTKEERAFLQSGKRVELNALTAPEFVEWITAALSKHLPRRLIPVDDVLEQAYRRALAVAKINQAIEDVEQVAVEYAEGAEIPDGLRDKLDAIMKKSSEPWDRALYRLAQENIQERE